MMIVRSVEYQLISLKLAIFIYFLSVLTQNQLYMNLKNWDCKMKEDILYEVKYLIHCIMYRGIETELRWVPSHCGLYWNEVSDKLAKQGAMKNMSETSYSNLLRVCLMRLFQYLRRMCIKIKIKVNLRYLLVRVI